MLNNLRTTITSIVGIAAYVVNKLFGIGIPETELVVIIIFVLGLVAGDSKKDE